MVTGNRWRRSRNFDISDLVRQILRPHHYKSMVKNWRAPLLDKKREKKTHINYLKHQVTDRLDTLNRKIATVDQCDQ